ncbi:hypothetical protein [Yersinia similis]|uniref:hypothetical protein n=1 Tax=Yersinia similis TaxID=367190 RepID=UPI003704D460
MTVVDTSQQRTELAYDAWFFLRVITDARGNALFIARSTICSFIPGWQARYWYSS